MSLIVVICCLPLGRLQSNSLSGERFHLLVTLCKENILILSIFMCMRKIYSIFWKITVFALGQVNSFQLIITSNSVLLVCWYHKPNSCNNIYFLHCFECGGTSVFSGEKGRMEPLTEESWGKSDRSASRREGRLGCSIWGTPSGNGKQKKDALCKSYFYKTNKTMKMIKL